MTRRELGKKIGRDASLIGRIINRKYWPSVEVAEKLGSVTHPHITALQWLDAKPKILKRLWLKFQRAYKVELLKSRMEKGHDE